MTLTTMSTVLLLVCALAEGVPFQGTQPVGITERVIIRDGTPIPSRIRPDDKVVVIERLTGPPLVVNPINPDSPQEELMELASYGDILVVDSVTAQSSLSDGDAWITTRVKGRVANVLKAKQSARTEGESIEFELDGGEVVVGAVTVRAGVVPVFRQSRYLVAFTFNALARSLVVTKLMAIDADGTLRSYERTGSQAPLSSALHGMNITDVLSQLKRPK
ncbi:MAG: hypothetical protein AAB403_22020 [Planctomycetota bacterium]